MKQPRLPYVLALVIFFAAAGSRILQAISQPYVFPQGPAATFYQAMLIGGSIWVVACLTILLVETVRISRRMTESPADTLYDADLDQYPTPEAADDCDLV